MKFMFDDPTGKAEYFVGYNFRYFGCFSRGLREGLGRIEKFDIETNEFYLYFKGMFKADEMESGEIFDPYGVKVVNVRNGAFKKVEPKVEGGESLKMPEPMNVMSESKNIRSEAEVAAEIMRDAEHLKAQLAMKEENDALRAKLKKEEEARLYEVEEQLEKAVKSRNEEDIRQAKVRQTAIAINFEEKMAKLEEMQENWRIQKEEEEQKREQERDEKMAMMQTKLDAQEEAHAKKEQEMSQAQHTAPQQIQSFVATSASIMLMINYTHPLSATMRHVYIDSRRILRAGNKEFPMTVTLEGPMIMFGEGKCLALGKDPLKSEGLGMHLCEMAVDSCSGGMNSWEVNFDYSISPTNSKQFAIGIQDGEKLNGDSELVLVPISDVNRKLTFQFSADVPVTGIFFKFLRG